MIDRPPRPTVTARPHGTGYITPVWQRARWRFKARFPDGCGGERTVGTFADEDRAHLELNAHVRARQEMGARPAATLLRDYGADWVDRLQDRNARSWRSTWRTVIAAAPFAAYPLDAIHRRDVQEWADRLLEHRSERTGSPISRQTAKHALGLVRRCLQAAVRDELIETNPADGVTLPAQVDPDLQDAWTFLTEAEIEHLLGLPWLPEKLRAAYAVAIYAGLRDGELAALRWEHVHLRERPRVHVRASWDTTTKTGTQRWVPLLEPARLALVAWWQLCGRPKAGLVWTSQSKGKRRGRAHSRGYDFGWADTRDYKRGVCWLGWKRRAGLGRRVRFHDLRHTCGSHLISGTWGRAWSLREVQELLGHADIQTTQRYAHLAPGVLDHAAAATPGIRLQSVRDDRASAPLPVVFTPEMLRQIVERAVGDSNARPSAPEAGASCEVPLPWPASDGSRTDSPEALLDHLRSGRAIPDRRAAEELAIGLLAGAGELVALAGGVLRADDNTFNTRLLELLERLIDSSTASAVAQGGRRG